MVKLAVAILHRTVSASPGFDSRPMHFALVESSRWWCCCFCLGERAVWDEARQSWSTREEPRLEEHDHQHRLRKHHFFLSAP